MVYFISIIGINPQNASSPNNDNINDAFCFKGSDACLENFSITIYDRWGEKNFQSADTYFCWDGIFNGKIMDARILVYFLNVKYTNQEKPLIKKGNISLIL